MMLTHQDTPRYLLEASGLTQFMSGLLPQSWTWISSNVRVSLFSASVSGPRLGPEASPSNLNRALCNA